MAYDFTSFANLSNRSIKPYWYGWGMIHPKTATQWVINDPTWLLVQNSLVTRGLNCIEIDKCDKCVK